VKRYAYLTSGRAIALMQAISRVVMATTLLLIAAYVEAVSETLRAVNPLYFLIGAVYLLTLLHVLACASWPSSPRLRPVVGTCW
jgi:hypothetical protein